MDGLMMDFPLTLSAILRRVEALYGAREIASVLPGKALFRYRYADLARRARRLAAALVGLGVQPGDRVATLCWNHSQHLEAYFGVPLCGAVLHTLNLRLSSQDLAYIVNHARDKVLLVDESLLSIFENFKDQIQVSRVVIIRPGGSAEAPAGPPGLLDYEQLIAAAGPGDASSDAQPAGAVPAFPEPDERQAALMCYTSGTTGRPKAVLYSHRALCLHSLASGMVDTLCISGRDVIAPVVPMFHANAWGLPFTAALVGASQVLPGPHLDPVSLLELFQSERVTVAAGVPTIWISLLQVLDRDPSRYDLSSLRQMIVGGSAAPESMIRAYEERHGLHIVHAWGMTELSPLGTVSRVPSELLSAPKEQHYACRATQGSPAPFIEIRARGTGGGLVPWDGRTLGELEVRGPWVARSYYQGQASNPAFTKDGWFCTGDIVSIDALGFIQIRDRAKDVIKSGGEWISSVALENALMGHPSVAEAAVIGVPHPVWQERPLAVVVLKEGRSATASELRDHLAPHFARWWLPDEVIFAPSIPKTSVGKFQKIALRERFSKMGSI